MPNMSYCRFENTYRDLQDCQQHMDEELSTTEKMYRNNLILLCQNIGDIGDVIEADDAL